MRRIQRTSVRDFGHPRHKISADPSHVARGQTRWHVEAPWFRCLHPQTGKVECVNGVLRSWGVEGKGR